MNGATWVLVEHLVSGRVSVGEYDHCRAYLQVDGKPARLGDYWCLAELAKVARTPKDDPPWQDLYGYDPADAEQEARS